jgi:hypothetical protein
MTKLSIKDLVIEIVTEQSLVIGSDLAINRAKQTGAVSFPITGISNLELVDTTPSVFSSLLASYEELFGEASVEVCMNVFRRYNKSELTGLLPKNLVSSL